MDVSRSYPKTVAELEARGLQLRLERRGKHFIGTLSNGLQLVFSCSLSDHRGDLNQRAFLRRQLARR